MYAIVESGSITKFLRGPQGVSIGGSQYSAKIFTLWTQSELEAVGIYEVEYDNSNKKNPGARKRRFHDWQVYKKFDHGKNGIHYQVIDRLESRTLDSKVYREKLS